MLIAAIVLYVLSNLVFAAAATFGQSGALWDMMYFICHDGTFVLLIWHVLSISKNPYHRALLPLLFLSIFIFLWDVVSYPAGIGVNHPIATGAIFGLATLTAMYFMIKDLKWRLKDL